MRAARPRAVCAVLALLAALTLAACNDGESDSNDQGSGASATEARLVDCADWRSADEGRRDDIVEALRRFAGGPSGSPAGRGATLGDDDARRLFDSYCAQEFATGFKLYKLYTRAASFGVR